MSTDDFSDISKNLASRGTTSSEPQNVWGVVHSLIEQEGSRFPSLEAAGTMPRDLEEDQRLSQL
jgi:hypothetical protein